VSGVARVFVAGSDAGLREAVGALLERPVTEGVPGEPDASDVVVLDGSLGAALPLGNVFSLCRSLKREPRLAVFVVLPHDDPFGAEIARFCLADGVLRRGPDGRVADLEALAAPRGAARRRGASVDELLATLEQGLADDTGGSRSALQRILADEGRDDLLAALTDPETGLFDGPFASFKLDEEFKRSSRFHQPLSVILLDCGVERWPDDRGERQLVLAEVAGVFLNEARDIDVLARFTETVFMFLLPGTGSDGAAAAARRMLAELRARPFGGTLRLAPAAGIATVPWAGVHDRRELLARAERSLRRALGGEGSDGVCVAGD